MEFQVDDIVRVVKDPDDWPAELTSRVGQTGTVVALNYLAEGVLYYVAFQQPWKNAHGYLANDLLKED